MTTEPREPLGRKSALQRVGNPAPSILRLASVKGRTGMSRSSIYARQSAGTFPKSITLGPRAVGWIEAEISAWIEQRIEESRKPGNEQRAAS